MIERVVVIVILAIMGGMLVPKFLNVGQDARVSAVKSMAAALNTASAQLRARCAVTQGCPMNSGSDNLSHDGRTYRMWNGHVDAGDSYAEAEIDEAGSHAGGRGTHSAHRDLGLLRPVSTPCLAGLATNPGPGCGSHCARPGP